MDIHSQRLLNIANKRFSEVLTDGFKLFTQTYGTLILSLASFQILLIILDIFLLTDFRVYMNTLGTTYTTIMQKFIEGSTLTGSEWNFLAYVLLMDWFLLFLQNLIGAIVITIAMCTVSNYVYRRYMKEDINFLDSFKSAFNKKMLLVILIIGICLPISSLLLFIPAIFVFGFFIFLIFTYNMEVRKNPISEARAIAKGAFWKIIGVFVINVILISIISFLFTLSVNIILNTDSQIFSANVNSWYNPTTRNYGMIILYEILMSFVDIIFAPMFICLITALFSSLKAKRDFSYLYQQGAFQIRETYEETYIQQEKPSEDDETHDLTPKVQIEGRFYCPFCGHFISTPKKFCPKCGEGLSFIS